MLSFSALFQVNDNGLARVEVVEARLLKILRIAAERIEVDEDWYQRTYPDVRDAIKRGNFSSAREHYVIDGYFENRLPRMIEVNANWYLERYPDVADAIRRGRIHSPQQHFQEDGFKEGRDPYSEWDL